MLILGLLYFVFKFGVRIGLDALVLKKQVRFLMLSSAAAPLCLKRSALAAVSFMSPSQLPSLLWLVRRSLCLQ